MKSLFKHLFSLCKFLFGCFCRTYTPLEALILIVVLSLIPAMWGLIKIEKNKESKSIEEIANMRDYSFKIATRKAQRKVGVPE